MTHFAIYKTQVILNRWTQRNQRKNFIFQQLAEIEVKKS